MWCGAVVVVGEGALMVWCRLLDVGVEPLSRVVGGDARGRKSGGDVEVVTLKGIRLEGVGSARAFTGEEGPVQVGEEGEEVEGEERRESGLAIA